MKFYIGDKVRILDGSGIENYTGGWFEAMNDDIGKTATIEGMEKYPENRYGFYFIGPGHLYNGSIYDKRGLELVELGPNAPKRRKKHKAKPTPKFKVGDKVIGNDGERYFCTNTGWIGTVVAVHDHTIDVCGPVNGADITTFFDLEPEYFDLYTEETGKAEETTEKPKEGKTLERGELVKTFFEIATTDGPLKDLILEMPLILPAFAIIMHEVEDKILGEE